MTSPEAQEEQEHRLSMSLLNDNVEGAGVMPPSVEEAFQYLLDYCHALEAWIQRLEDRHKRALDH